jgi:hypothetical protein
VLSWRGGKRGFYSVRSKISAKTGKTLSIHRELSFRIAPGLAFCRLRLAISSAPDSQLGERLCSIPAGLAANENKFSKSDVFQRFRGDLGRRKAVVVNEERAHCLSAGNATEASLLRRNAGRGSVKSVCVKTISQVKTFSSGGQLISLRITPAAPPGKASMSFACNDFPESLQESQVAVEEVWRIKCSPMPWKLQ